MSEPAPKAEPAFFYRFEDRRYADFDPWADGDVTSSHLEVHLKKFILIKTTSKGAWIDMGFGAKRFVLSGARKKFACQTLELAHESFLARKRRQIWIYEKKMRDAEDAIAKANRMMKVKGVGDPIY